VLSKKVVVVFLFLALPQLLAADAQWALARSTLTYHISHPLHAVDGVSHAARGKGVCHASQCDFLITAPVTTFKSGNKKTDLHMLQVVRGTQFPMIVVRLRFPEAALASKSLRADLKIQFAGQTVEYKQVLFQRVTNGNDATIIGTIPIKISDLRIEPPEFLDIPIKDDLPVHVIATWRRL
jgi:hypothetical protein